mmetsp:Transcript_81469/g.263896  ORF Transcript_81469/g.263896 Transcript_81469/m.263896 type:complete len:235 (+) Transcript_81469:1157-1861(+)
MEQEGQKDATQLPPGMVAATQLLPWSWQGQVLREVQAAWQKRLGGRRGAQEQTWRLGHRWARQAPSREPRGPTEACRPRRQTWHLEQRARPPSASASMSRPWLQALLLAAMLPWSRLPALKRSQSMRSRRHPRSSLRPWVLLVAQLPCLLAVAPTLSRGSDAASRPKGPARSRCWRPLPCRQPPPVSYSRAPAPALSSLLKGMPPHGSCAFCLCAASSQPGSPFGGFPSVPRKR